MCQGQGGTPSGPDPLAFTPWAMERASPANVQVAGMLDVIAILDRNEARGGGSAWGAWQPGAALAGAGRGRGSGQGAQRQSSPRRAASPQRSRGGAGRTAWQAPHFPSGAAAAWPAAPYMAGGAGHGTAGSLMHVPAGYAVQLVPDPAGVPPPPSPWAGVAPPYPAHAQQQPPRGASQPAQGGAPAAQQDDFWLPAGYERGGRTTRRFDRAAGQQQRRRDYEAGVGAAPWNPDRSTTGAALAGQMCPGVTCHANHAAAHCGRNPRLCAQCCKAQEAFEGPGYCQPGMSWLLTTDLHNAPRLRNTGRAAAAPRY